METKIKKMEAITEVDLLWSDLTEKAQQKILDAISEAQMDNASSDSEIKKDENFVNSEEVKTSTIPIGVIQIGIISDGGSSERAINETNKKIASIRNYETEEIADEIEKKLKLRISDMDLSTRTLNCLKKINITHIGQLISLKNKMDLLKLRNFGKHSLNDIEYLLDGFKLSFEMDVEKYGYKTGYLKSYISASGVTNSNFLDFVTY
jgi:hypothetical protein